MNEIQIKRADKTRTTVRRPRGHVLIVDDEIFVRNAFKLFFETIGFQVRAADGAKSARKVLADTKQPLDVVLLDLVMPGVHGLELLAEFKQARPDVEVVIATGCGSVSTAIEAMRGGAYDYITKPIVHFEEELLRVVEEAIVHRNNTLRARRSRPGARTARGGATSPGLAEKFLRLAELVGFWKRAGADGPPSASSAEPEQVRDLTVSFLVQETGVAAGLILRRSEAGPLTPALAWGGLHEVPFATDWFSNPDLYRAVCRGEMFIFPIDDLNTESLGLKPQIIGHTSLGIHVPLVLEGCHRGAAFLLFKKRLDRFRKAEIVDGGRPFVLAAPLLASIFLGTTAAAGE